jgi:thiaminase/transcriptional activator TenA
MKWSKNAWDSISDIYDKTLKSTFISELIRGSLSKERFIFYIQQDALYLVDFGKSLAAIASKLDEPAQRAMMLGFASESIAVEAALHEAFFNQYGINREIKIPQSPSCLLYTSYLLRMTNAPVEVTMAAVLPCFWIYMEVGNYIKAEAKLADNPYRAWIETYGGEEYAQSVYKAIDICDALAERSSEERRAEMTEAFITCSRMEWMFWESAYNLETWKI